MSSLPDWTRRRIDEAVRKVETRLDDLTRQQPDEFGGHSRVPVTFYNQSSSTIPPYGVMAIVDAAKLPNGQPVLKCDQPGASGDTGNAYAVNLGRPVATQTMGQCITAGWCLVACDTGTPANGDRWGPKAGQWTATKGGTPGVFTIAGIYSEANSIAIAVLSARQLVRFFTGMTTAAVAASDASFTVSGLAAVDGGGLPAADSGSNWTVRNDGAGDGYKIDSGKAGKLIGYGDGTLHPLDFPCSTGS